MTAYTMQELADRLGNNAADNLWALIAIGCPGWWYYEGQRMRTDYLCEWLKRDHHYNPIPFVQVELTEEQELVLAAELGVDVAEMRGMEVRS